MNKIDPGLMPQFEPPKLTEVIPPPAKGRKMNTVSEPTKPDPVFDTPYRFERPGQIIAVGISILLVIYVFALAVGLVSAKGWTIAEVLLAAFCIIPMWLAVYLLGYIRSSLDILSSLSARANAQVWRDTQPSREKAPN